MSISADDRAPDGAARERSPRGGGDAAEPYWRIVARPASVLIAIAAVALAGRYRTEPRALAPVSMKPETPAPRPEKPAPAATAATSQPRVEPRPATARIEVDRDAVARAEADRDAADRDRARAEARTADLENRLRAAAEHTAVAQRDARSLSKRVRDPSARIQLAARRGALLRAERDRLRGEVARLDKIPKPRPKSLVDQNPVAKQVQGEEHHFEIRRDRVTYINLDKLVEIVKQDAKLRVRLSNGARVITSRVGPVGSFSMRYEFAMAVPGSVEELMERRGVNFDLRSWELVPEFDGRGETYDAAMRPMSEYNRALHRIDAGRSTVTIWVYPDGFRLYRKLRDALHARGYLVAARPLPEGIPMRASSNGSFSAGQ